MSRSEIPLRRLVEPAQLDVLAWRSAFIRIGGDIALIANVPVDDDGPDGPEGMFQAGTFDERLDFRSGDPKPEQADDGLRHNDGCRNSGN